MLPDYIGWVTLVLKPIGWVARQVASWRNREAETLEESILEYLANHRDWQSPGIVWAELVLGPILKDVHLDILIQPTSNGWAKFRWRLKNLGYNARHDWRMWVRCIPKRQVERLMRRLWGEGRLDRAFWAELYRLKI